MPENQKTDSIQQEFRPFLARKPDMLKYQLNSENEKTRNNAVCKNYAAPLNHLRIVAAIRDTSPRIALEETLPL